MPRRLIVWWTEAFKAPVVLDDSELAYLRERGIDLETYLYETVADWSAGPDVRSTSFEIYSIVADEGDPLPGLTAASDSEHDAPLVPEFPSPAEVQGIVRTLADFQSELGSDFDFLSERQQELMHLCHQHVSADSDPKETT